MCLLNAWCVVILGRVDNLEFLLKTRICGLCPKDPLEVVRKLRHALGGRGEEFVTVQTQNFSFFGKFVTRGGGGGLKKSFVCVT